MFASRIHDMGESMHPRIAERCGEVVGDIPAGKKTDIQRAIEARVRKFVYDELYGDVHTDVIERVEGIIAHQDDSVLHEYFELAHELQTFETALRAKSAYEAEVSFHHGEVMDVSSNDGGRRSGLLGLYSAVYLRTGHGLLEAALEHPYVAKVIEPYAGDLERHVNYGQVAA
jgi:hypothetical protein